MTDFNIRSDSVNVEQIMQQIRARIREKRGVDYTEEQIRELAAVKLERFLDPQKVRSGLLEQFREGGVSPFENYEFEDTTLFESHRAPLRWIRRLLRPVLKLFFNPNRLITVLHLQSRINTRQAQFAEVSYEVLHNMVVETTRLGIEVKNLKMRLESMSSRFDFAERRARALEGMVQYRSADRPEEAAPRRGAPVEQAAPPQPQGQPGQPGARDEQSGEGRRRRRRRRGRRSGAGRPGAENSPVEAPGQEAEDTGPQSPEDGADEQAPSTTSPDRDEP